MKAKHMQHGWAILVLLIVAAMFVTGNAAAAVLVAPAAFADLDAVAEAFEGVKSKLANDVKELKDAKGEYEAKLGEFGTKIDQKLKDAIDAALTKYNEKYEGLKGEFQALEQKTVDARNSQPEKTKSWGEQFIESSQFKSIEDNGSQFRGSVGCSVKAVDSVAAGGLIRSYRENDVVNLLRERRVVRDLLRTIPVTTSSVDYVTQTTRTNAAAPVAEGAAKPYSDYAWASATVVVRVLAHLAKMSRQAMDDAPRLVGEIDSEMRYGLGYVEERQFLYGTGIGQNLHGIVPQAATFAVPAGFERRPGTTKIDVLRVAMLQNSIAMLPADGIVLNEIDWADIELTKTTDGAYLFANPQGSVSPRMWGLPVVNTPAMTAGDFLVGNFQLGAVVYDRMGVEVLISTENVDDFEKNLATMRAEERVAIAVKRPQAFTKGTFTTAITAVNPP